MHHSANTFAHTKTTCKLHIKIPPKLSLGFKKSGVFRYFSVILLPSAKRCLKGDFYLFRLPMKNPTTKQVAPIPKDLIIVSLSDCFDD